MRSGVASAISAPGRDVDALYKAALQDRPSKTCSACGAVTTKPALSEREFACEACGLVIDRDRNAALNLAALAAKLDTAGSRPEDPRMRAGGCEA
ncbi:zinc ribbon domain-containing protein [Actinoplanes solisilvae]|uniref:zinc ribbon domain-containing protein n=1 Tax=Actinoplanes solisilvae TaxID=2486853 RepID=UPI00196B3FD4|nr:zinc ribbon domain-containing protein [Actinoplanes solisilvae]